MILPFITHTVDVKRTVEVWYTSSFQIVETGIDTNIQPLSSSNLLFDIELKQYLCLLFTDNDTLIQENDVIVDQNWREYSVSNVDFYIWPEVNSMELILVLKK